MSRLIHLLTLFTCSRSADYLGLRGYTCARIVYLGIASDYSSLAKSNVPVTCSWLAVGHNLVEVQRLIYANGDSGELVLGQVNDAVLLYAQPSTPVGLWRSSPLYGWSPAGGFSLTCQPVKFSFTERITGEQNYFGCSWELRARIQHLKQPVRVTMGLNRQVHGADTIMQQQGSAPTDED